MINCRFLIKILRLLMVYMLIYVNFAWILVFLPCKYFKVKAMSLALEGNMLAQVFRQFQNGRMIVTADEDASDSRQKHWKGEEKMADKRRKDGR